MRSSISELTAKLKAEGIKGRYVPVRNLHLTLAFLGESDKTKIISQAMSCVKFAPFELEMSDMGAFGDILWIGAGKNSELYDLAKDLRTRLDSYGIGYDRKKFVPHITIARDARGNRKDTPAPDGNMTVNKISLMKSELINGKRVYTEIFSADAQPLALQRPTLNKNI